MRKLSMLVALLCVVVLAGAQSNVVVRLDGVGPVKVGMTITELNAALHQMFSLPDDKEDQGCFYVDPKDYPALMIENGRIVRVDVGGPGISTEKGIQVGDTEERAKEVYGSELKVTPSFYDGDEGGHYLTLTSGKYGLRFETEKGKITEYYAGSTTAIQYVEGCE